MHAAFKAWDRTDEPLETTELRIHDGAPLEGLRKRGHWYLNTLRQLFPWSAPEPGAVLLEIGGGLGYVMEAALEQFAPQRVIGLDVAPSMIEKAEARLRRDGVSDPRLEFMLYDGVTIPLADDSIDYVYSVAALQHVPKVYVYNLLLEIQRILAPQGYCSLHLLSCNNIREHSRLVPFAQEIRSQLRGEDTHWHHFYAFDELLCVLADGVEAKQIDIVDGEVSIWASFAKTGDTFHRADLPCEAHLPIARQGTSATANEQPRGTARRVVLPLAAWRPMTIRRVANGVARRVRATARRMRTAMGIGAGSRAAASASHAAIAAPQRAIDAGVWPQGGALLPWYDRDDWAEAIVRMRRASKIGQGDAAMLRKWCEDGYVVVPGLVSAALIDAFVREIDDVWERTTPIDGLAVSDVHLDEGYKVHVPHVDLVRLDFDARQRIKERSNWRIGEYHLFSTAAREIFDHQEIARVASTIFACRGEPRYSLMFSKGTEQGLHQDTCVFHIFPRNFMMGIWIACEDITHESGPLEYYPGSHRTPLFAEFTNYPQTNRRTSDPEQSKRYDEHVVNLAKGFEKHELLVRKGDVMFWHPMLIHGGCPRLERLKTRKSFVLHAIAEGCDMGGRVKGPFNW
jgi:ectoine hydroxylase-related dioxygenase (phytanoyl-CoA dioxygenase family)/ubiquinone/menaquinone biosynthesis C-methylase UbiE